MPSRPPRLDTFTIVPRSRSSMRGSTAWPIATGERKFVRITSSTVGDVELRDVAAHRAGRVVDQHVEVTERVPGLEGDVGRGATGRERSTAQLRWPGSSPGDAATQAARTSAKPIGPAGDDADRRAPCGQRRGERRADARRRAGDEDGRALERLQCPHGRTVPDACVRFRGLGWRPMSSTPEEGIRRTLAQYAQLCDEGRFAEWGDLFEPDARFHVMGETQAGRAASRRSSSLRSRRRLRGKHAILSSVIDLADDGRTARGSGRTTCSWTSGSGSRRSVATTTS